MIDASSHPQAITWSWRPYSCALSPVRGEVFDRWLGKRNLLFLGDSLTAQAYYSFVWLLGDSLLEQQARSMLKLARAWAP
tara:strand:+ start:2185 stop:2424 length:240 start_codon:yes stop_codon:yes gene_type:complete